MLDSEQLFIQLRSALNHLYDPYYLRKCSLVRVFGLGEQPDTPAALNRIINEAIQDMEPSKDDPDYAQRRKFYELIMYRYVQQFSQEEVAAQLGLSVRHLRREQNTAIYHLAAHLWDKYSLDERPFNITEIPSDEGALLASEPVIEESPVKQSNEVLANALQLDWLKDLPMEEPTQTFKVLNDVIDLSLPLASRYGAELELELSEDFPNLAIHQVALRQLLLNVLSVNICLLGVGKITLSGASSSSSARITIATHSKTGHCRETTADEKSSLAIARQLAQYYQGDFSFQKEEAACVAEITLPVFHPLSVLVIDDNIDFIQLVDRTLSGTHYKVFGERNPVQALESAELTSPDIILLDVMMPKVDGWEILGRLRQHPGTDKIPVIICTILPQEELALSLGARLFLRKPVRPEEILDALNQLTEMLGQEYH